MRKTATEPTIRWSSTYKDGTFQCRLEDAPVYTNPRKYVYDTCYVATEQDSAMTLNSRRVTLEDSSGFLPPLARLTFSESNATRCIVCTREHDPINTCLACKGASLTVSDAEYRPEFLQSGLETLGNNKFFFCRFRIQPNTTSIDSAWLNDRCVFDENVQDPVSACSVTASYIKPRTHKRFMKITAKAHKDDECRVCMIRANGRAVTIARACIDQNYELYIRDVRVGTIVTIIIYLMAIGILGIIVSRALYRENPVRRFIKKMLGVRTTALQVTTFVFLFVFIGCDIVSVTVPDSVNVNIVKTHEVLLSGLELCYGTRFSYQKDIDELLKR